MNEHLKWIEHGSEGYEDIVALRYKILRKPLNLHFTPEQLAEEKNYFHLGYYLDNKINGCLMLCPEENGRIKMKQVAVAEEFQGKGIGAKMIKEAEEFASEKGFTLMYCHARDTAVPFYEKLGYHKEGDMFVEVTIPHYEMEKNLLELIP